MSAIDNKPIIICTKGHKYNLKNSQDEMTAISRWQGSKQCPMLTSYDRLSGHSYCNAKLKDIEEIINTEYEKLFTRYKSQYDKSFFKTHIFIHAPLDGVEIKQKMRELLMDGKIIKGCYVSTNIRNVHNYAIYYKKTK
jgi:hypothetical protein